MEIVTKMKLIPLYTYIQLFRQSYLKSSLYGRGIMDSELLFKFIGYFPDYLSALSRTLLRFFWTTFVKTTVYLFSRIDSFN